ncbi:MAG TPA: hypothetical protein VGW38_07950, partial [Chloroflexota bacterium]|nr:hypothetical protein [Chloroflexota bacterium]
LDLCTRQAGLSAPRYGPLARSLGGGPATRQAGDMPNEATVRTRSNILMGSVHCGVPGHGAREPPRRHGSRATLGWWQRATVTNLFPGDGRRIAMVRYSLAGWFG